MINPNEIVKDYGADALWIYEMLMELITVTLPWSETGLTGERKWLERIYNQHNLIKLLPKRQRKGLSDEMIQTYYKFIYDVINAIETYKLIFPLVKWWFIIFIKKKWFI